MYSFSGFLEIVDIVINKLNFYILLGGFVIFKNVKQFKEVVKYVLME